VGRLGQLRLDAVWAKVLVGQLIFSAAGLLVF